MPEPEVSALQPGPSDCSSSWLPQYSSPDSPFRGHRGEGDSTGSSHESRRGLFFSDRSSTESSASSVLHGDIKHGWEDTPHRGNSGRKHRVGDVILTHKGEDTESSCSLSDLKTVRSDRIVLSALRAGNVWPSSPFREPLWGRVRTRRHRLTTAATGGHWGVGWGCRWRGGGVDIDVTAAVWCYPRIWGFQCSRVLLGCEGQSVYSSHSWHHCRRPVQLHHFSYSTQFSTFRHYVRPQSFLFPV